MAHQPLAGHVNFVATGGRTARETLPWEASKCMGYHAIFGANDGTACADLCQLVIAARNLVLTPGDPAAGDAHAPRLCYGGGGGGGSLADRAGNPAGTE